MGLLTTSDSAPNYGDGLCILSAILFGVHKWRSEVSTSRFQENTTELVALQLGTLAVAANFLWIAEHRETSRHTSWWDFWLLFWTWIYRIIRHAFYSLSVSIFLQWNKNKFDMASLASIAHLEAWVWSLASDCQSFYRRFLNIIVISYTSRDKRLTNLLACFTVVGESVSPLSNASNGYNRTQFHIARVPLVDLKPVSNAQQCPFWIISEFLYQLTSHSAINDRQRQESTMPTLVV